MTVNLRWLKWHSRRSKKKAVPPFPKVSGWDCGRIDERQIALRAEQFSFIIIGWWILVAYCIASERRDCCGGGLEQMVTGFLKKKCKIDDYWKWLKVVEKKRVYFPIILNDLIDTSKNKKLVTILGSGIFQAYTAKFLNWNYAEKQFQTTILSSLNIATPCVYGTECWIRCCDPTQSVTNGVYLGLHLILRCTSAAKLAPNRWLPGTTPPSSRTSRKHFSSLCTARNL